MKRHAGLQTLSRDHHFALVYAKRLQHYQDAEEAWLTRNRAVVQERLQDFWKGALAAHFAAEEEHLPWDRIPPIWREQLLQEHAWIKRLWHAAGSAAAPSKEMLAELGKALHDHARWEDRELFPAIEAALAQPELDALEIRFTGLPAADPQWLPPKPEAIQA